MIQDQSDRIDRLLQAEPAPTGRLTLRFTAADARLTLEGARAVMRQVAQAQSGSWPDDDRWRQRLPRWFVQSFEGHAPDELLRNPALWDFGSWLDAMRHPGWQWWSCRADGQQGVVELAAHAWPFAVEPLLYLLRAAGAQAGALDEPTGR